MPWGAFHSMIVTFAQFHPATKILLWLGFAITVQVLGVAPLALLSVVLASLLLAGHDARALGMVRRARWLLLSLLLIYSFATPGDPILPALGTISPSLQGIQGGAMQAWRLILLLLALGLLLRSCPNNSLLSGLFTLLRPFRVAGINADRIAVRLWLTLQYAEQQPRRKIQEWWSDLHSTLDPAPDAVREISLEIPAFTWRDGFALALAACLIGLAWW